MAGTFSQVRAIESTLWARGALTVAEMTKAPKGNSRATGLPSVVETD